MSESESDASPRARVCRGRLPRVVGGGARGDGVDFEVVDGPSLMAMRPLDGSGMADVVFGEGGKST